MASVPALRARRFSREACALILVSLAMAGCIAFIAVQRLSSGIREFESFNAIMGMRAAQGVPLYPDPRQQPLGTIYTPFYFLLGGALHAALPDPWGWERLVSLAAALLSAWYAYSISRRLGAGREGGLWSAALFLATYAVMECRYDEITPNPLLMCVSVAAVDSLLRRTPAGDGMALFLAGLACFTKQSAILEFIVILVTVLIQGRPTVARLWPLAFWAAAGIVLLYATGGRAWDYLVTYVGGHPMRPWPDAYCLKSFFILQAPLWVCFLHGAVKRRDPRFLMAFAAVTLSGILGLWKVGGWISALFPAEPLLCAAAGIIPGRIPRALALAQLAIGIYNPFAPLFPWATFRDVDRLEISVARATRGEVWLPVESYLAATAGKPEWDHFGALESYCWGRRGAPERLVSALRERRFGAILMRRDGHLAFRGLPEALLEEVDANYAPQEHSGLVVYRPRVP